MIILFLLYWYLMLISISNLLILNFYILKFEWLLYLFDINWLNLFFLLFTVLLDVVLYYFIYTSTIGGSFLITSSSWESLRKFWYSFLILIEINSWLFIFGLVWRSARTRKSSIVKSSFRTFFWTGILSHKRFLDFLTFFIKLLDSIFLNKVCFKYFLRLNLLDIWSIDNNSILVLFIFMKTLLMTIDLRFIFTFTLLLVVWGIGFFFTKC